MRQAKNKLEEKMKNAYTKQEVIYHLYNDKDGCPNFSHPYGWDTGVAITTKRTVITHHNGQRVSLQQAPATGWKFDGFDHEI
jgi:hypothetical protein